MDWQTFIRKHPLLFGGLSVVAVVLAVISMRRQVVRPNYLPRETYRCEAGHSWTARVSGRPTCPECGAEAISESRFRCRACGQDFVGLESRKEGVGQFFYRLPGRTEWMATPPEALTCPHCGVRAGIIGGFTGLGFGDRPSDTDSGDADRPQS